MAHVIEYQGEASVAVDAVLRYLASNDDWYVEIEGPGPAGTITTGWVTRFEEVPEVGGQVTLAQTASSENDAPDDVTIQTADIVRLVIP